MLRVLRLSTHTLDGCAHARSPGNLLYKRFAHVHCLYTHPSVCLSVCPSVCPSISLSLSLPLSPSVSVSVSVSVSLSLYLSLFLFLCMHDIIHMHIQPQRGFQVAMPLVAAAAPRVPQRARRPPVARSESSAEEAAVG